MHISIRFNLCPGRRKFSRFVAALLLVSLSCGPCAIAGDPRVGDVTDPVLPAEKLDRALNGTFAFPPPPVVKWTPDETGFAKDRLFTVPPAGEHPRILFSESDLPRIRKHMGSNEAGVGIVAAFRALIAKGIGTAGTWEAQCFSALADGDLEAFKIAYKESPQDNNPPGSGFRSNVPGRSPATKWSTRNPLLASMEAAALLALVDDDAAFGQRVATAWATYAKFIGPKVDAANATPRSEFHWASTRDFLPNEVAYGYDWSWKWMTPTQRDDMRGVILRATVGKYTLGMDLPAHWRNWNHLGMTDTYAACMFAIEGEPGDDPRGRDRIFEVYRDYLSYGINDLGFGTEGIGYQTMGIGHMSAPLVAFANRGKNLLIHPHWRLHTESWLVQAMQPYGGAWQSNSDLGNFSPSLWLVMVQKYFYPDSAGIEFVLQNHPSVMKKDWPAIAADACEAQWIMAAVPSGKDVRSDAQKQAAALVGGGVTFYDPGRGSMYTRTGWGERDLVLHVDCRNDTTFANHDHPDRGQFTLSALGRAWACDGYRDTESKYHNVVTIDGRGQGYFATPGRWVDYQNTDDATTAVVDSKYCWDWMWMKSSFTESKQSLERRNQGVFVESAERLQARVPVDKWETDPTVKWYYEGFADRALGDPRMWDDEDGWVVRAPWYPVKKALRTVTLARGKHPYVLVVDDIRKDDAEHLYEWRMNMPPDVSAVSITGADILLGDATTTRKPAANNYGFQGKTDLAPAPGDRLLLVRTLDIAVPELPTLQPIPMVASIEFKKTDDAHQFTGRSMGMGTQVVIGSRSIEPGFLVLLYPHEQGQPIPKTSWNENKTTLTVSWPDQTDIYAITTSDGRRVLTKSK